ncbi:hypothetical protein JL720_14897 [Aureococcus anophagefferens]|nr:hypothetical protein JL720_14897 [Aureococcus anophagefferens]
MVVKQRKNLLVENVVDPASGEVLEEFRLPPWWPKRLRPPRRLARACRTRNSPSPGNFEGDDIFADLYAGAGPSIAAAAPAAATYYLRIVAAAVIPLRSLFYTGLRDALILDGVFEFDA